MKNAPHARRGEAGQNQQGSNSPPALTCQHPQGAHAGRDLGWSALCDALEASKRARPVPPLTWSGDLANTVMDRVALHLRAKAPTVFGAMTLDEINLMFAGLRDEISRLCPEEEG